MSKTGGLAEKQFIEECLLLLQTVRIACCLILSFHSLSWHNFAFRISDSTYIPSEIDYELMIQQIGCHRLYMWTMS